MRKVRRRARRLSGAGGPREGMVGRSSVGRRKAGKILASFFTDSKSAAPFAGRQIGGPGRASSMSTSTFATVFGNSWEIGG